MEKYIFGVDLGGTTVKLGLFDGQGALLDKWEIVTVTANKGERILPDITDSIKAKMEEKGISADQLKGIGLGVPGAVMNDSYADPCVNLDQWGGFDAAAELTRLCGAPAKVANDANVAAIGEFVGGAAKGYTNVVMITLGTGVGCGIILNKRLLRGSHGAGGEFGHVKIHDDCPVTCGCGGKGCLEQYTSATGIVRCAKLALAESDGNSAMAKFEKLTCKDVFDCAKAGDQLALKIVDDMGRDLGMSLANAANLIDPEIIVIGGGVSRAGQIIIDAIKKYYPIYAFPACRDVEFKLATLGNDAGIYGAAGLILEK
ncbi:MAG: ROK family glucokinase [Lachnospiraceae bacterium]|nr:ROK family glucokinase [Candidatus Equihabitans merdae]